MHHLNCSRLHDQLWKQCALQFSSMRASVEVMQTTCCGLLPGMPAKFRDSAKCHVVLHSLHPRFGGMTCLGMSVGLLLSLYVSSLVSVAVLLQVSCFLAHCPSSSAADDGYPGWLRPHCLWRQMPMPSGFSLLAQLPNSDARH